MNVLAAILLFPLIAYSETQVYLGEAYKEKELVYKETHSVEFQEKKLLTSRTEYTSSEGKLLAILTNNYEKSLSAPEHEMKDIVHKTTYGLRYKGLLPVMYRLENGKEELKEVHHKDPSKLLVGGQGLHYYLVANMEEVIQKKKIDMKFLIPGKLDSYDFYLKLSKTTETEVVFDVEIDSWFLRLFAPGLKLVYDRKEKKLIRYSGLSNIQDEKKKIMNIDLTYFYK